MSGHESERALARRSFLSKLGIGLTAGGAALGTRVASAQTPPADSRWQPARHALDDWFDQIPGKHRYVIDTYTPEGFGGALPFLNNYFAANQTAYGLQDADLAVVLVARHLSTLFAYNDAMWAKYGVPITERTRLNDPNTRQAPRVNLFNAAGYGASLANRGTTLDSLLKRGLHLAVCQTSTRVNAAAIAAATAGTPEAVYNDLVANLVSRNAHMVPAGIIAVNRAQERGYSLASIA